MRLTFAAMLLLSMQARAVDDAALNAAIAKGVKYLETAEYKIDSDHGIGPMCLAGLAMLEGDVKPGTNVIKHIHGMVRTAAIREVGTYQVALAILFLDRYGDPSDVGLIQILGARLLAGQSFAGGWTYKTFNPVGDADVARIMSVLSAPPQKGYLNSEAARILTMLGRGERPEAALAADDNSNTQFALMAIWVARRSGLPTNNAINRIQARFLRSQSTSDGGWSYSSSVGQSSSPAMTCAGLLGLAVAKAAGESELTTVRTEGAKKPEDEDPFQKPPVPGKPAEDADAPPAEVAVETSFNAQRDKAIERAITAVGKLLVNPPNLREGQGNGSIGDIYFVWSLERVAVAYGLDTFGGIDWHRWGADALIPVQKPNGCWSVGYTEVIDTSFAILFLKKANLTADLTRQIAGKIKDPGSGELRGARNQGPTATISTAVVPQTVVVDGKTVPINKLRTTDAAERIAEGLASAGDREWPVRLKAAKETAGPQNTVGLVLAIGALEGKRLYQAREALSERLTRMDTPTLKRMLADRDAEIRRAACLAVAMKDDKLLAPQVIDCIIDPHDAVVRAARASLRAMSNEDHGPVQGSSDEEKRKAAEEWRKWYSFRK